MESQLFECIGPDIENHYLTFINIRYKIDYQLITLRAKYFMNLSG